MFKFIDNVVDENDTPEEEIIEEKDLRKKRLLTKRLDHEKEEVFDKKEGRLKPFDKRDRKFDWKEASRDED